jgi:hypothetical protein
MNTTTASAATVMNTAPRRKGRWLRNLLWLWLALCAVALLAAFTLLGNVQTAPLEITINGTPMVTDLDLAGAPAAHKVMLALAVAAALLLALLLTVASLMAVAVVLVPVLLLAVALPVLVGGVVLLALLSPLLLLAWLMWRAAKRSPRSTTIPA